MKALTALLFILLLGSNLIAQDRHDLDTNVVKTIDGTVNETLKIIAGERGENRNWEAFRQLFTPSAQITVLVHDSSGYNIARSFTLEEFVRMGMKYYERVGFIEYELKKTIDEYNGIAHVFQSYYAKELDTEEEGINSYQLIFDGKRWWITSILWASNKNGVELPEEYKK